MADTAPIPPLDDLYEADFYVWTLEQAQRLRDLARAGGLPPGLDWDRIAEEIEDLGKSERRGYASHVRNILVHLYKLAWFPDAPARNHWRGEISAFRDEAEGYETRTLRKQIIADLEGLHIKAARTAALQSSEFATKQQRVDRTLRWTLPQILGEADDPLDA
jgi:hypothetical protein